MIGKSIRELRIKNRLSQVDLAKELGVSQKTIKNWEADLSNPNLQNLIEIADLYHVSLDELVGRSTGEIIHLGMIAENDRRKLIALIQTYIDMCS